MTSQNPSFLGDIAFRQRQGAKPGLVFLHGYKSDMEGTKALALDEWCTEWHRAYLRFDVRGHGLSPHGADRFEDLCVSHWFEDAARAFDELTTGPQILVGSSMGGWLAFLLAKRFPERVKHVIGVNAAPDFTKRLPDRGEMHEDGVHFGDGHLATKAFLEDGNRLAILDGPIGIACPVTLLQGREDDVVPWQLAEEIKAKLAPGQCEIIYIEDGDHRLNRPDDLAALKKAVETAF